MKCNSVCCRKCNVCYHELRVGVKGKRQFTCGRYHWSQLYHQLIAVVPTEVHFQSIIRSFLIFYNHIIKNLVWKKIWHSSSHTEEASALILHFVHVFYTLKHVLSEMIELAPPCHVCVKRRDWHIWMKVIWMCSMMGALWRQLTSATERRFLGTISVRRAVNNLWTILQKRGLLRSKLWDLIRNK